MPLQGMHHDILLGNKKRKKSIAGKRPFPHCVGGRSIQNTTRLNSPLCQGLDQAGEGQEDKDGGEAGDGEEREEAGEGDKEGEQEVQGEEKELGEPGEGEGQESQQAALVQSPTH